MGEAFYRWVRYYLDTELFDRSLPHRMGENGAIPYDMATSSAYARRRYRELNLYQTGGDGKADAAQLSLECLRQADIEGHERGFRFPHPPEISWAGGKAPSDD